MRQALKTRRQGSILPLTVCLLLVLFAFLALSVDLGMMTLARNHCQNAADAAATAAARTINGDPDADYRLDLVPQKGVAAGVANKILSRQIQGDSENLTEINATTFQSGDVKLELGSYAYYYSDDDPIPDVEGFKLRFPRERETDPWSAVRATITASNMQTYFAPVLGMNSYTVGAVATAVHRPRDVVIIVDMSGSMRFQSLPGTPMNGSDAAPSAQDRARTRSLNPESVFPRFGHYSAISTAALQGTASIATSGDEYVDPANISVTTAGGPPIIEDFYRNTAAEAPAEENRAFSRKPDGQQNTPGGDNFWKTSNNTGANYAKTVQEITGGTGYDSTWETSGYGANFQGYTEGPGYWGKTFFIWPPDPRGTSASVTAANYANNGAKDWRKRFFIKVRTSNSTLSWLDDDTLLWDSNGNLKKPGDVTIISSVNYTFRINYAAIFHWLKNTGTNPFPNQLRAGRIKYYDAIPDPSDTGLNNRFWTTSTLSNQNERFWKEYVDFVLGYKGTGAGTYTSTQNGVNISSLIGNGDYYSWGTAQIYSKPSGQYIDYRDNPKRPRHQYWFGPMTFVDFIGNYNTNKFWWPGNCHEAQAWACKIGVQSAIQDIRTNHPNDFISLVYFSSPKYSNNGSGQHNRAKVPVGQDYQRLIDSLWFPPSTITGTATEITPYSADMSEVPRANGGTSPAMGFMLAYNQLSSSYTNLRVYASPSTQYRGDAGGLGRKGAQRLIVFETDGAPNTLSAASLEGSGSDAYYEIRVKNPEDMSHDDNSEWPSSTGTLDSQLYGVVDQICALESASGFSTERKPVLIHSLAYGSLYEPINAGTTQNNALARLQEIQYRGKTQTAANVSLPDYKRIYGTNDERIERLREAFTRIMQDGVQVSLIE